jgi:hypothetical protein
VTQERAHIQPSIYVHLLADANGIAPTATQDLLICERIIDYLELTRREQDRKMPWRIDKVTAPAVTRSAYRKFLWTSASGNVTSLLLRYLEEMELTCAFQP